MINLLTIRRKPFSYADELLCTIPCEPGWVLIKTLLFDFGIESEEAFRQMLHVHVAMGDLRIANSPSPTHKGRCIYWTTDGWARNQETLHAYWEQTHGKEKIG